jgi:hypothetical protein
MLFIFFPFQQDPVGRHGQVKRGHAVFFQILDMPTASAGMAPNFSQQKLFFS